MNVILQAAGGLECDGGLGVHIYGDPGPTAIVDAAFQQLGVTPAGELWSIPKKADLSTYGTGATAISHSSTFGAPTNIPFTSGANIVNPFNATALIIYIGQFQLGYTIEANAEAFTVETVNGALNMVPYEAQVGARLKVDNVPKKTVYFDPGGMADNDKMPQHRRRWQDFVHFETILPNSSVTLSAEGWVQGAEGGNPAGTLLNVNVQTPPGSSPVFADRGIQVSGRAIIIPMGVV